MEDISISVGLSRPAPVVFQVSKPVIDVRALQLENIFEKSFTLSVLKFGTFKLVSALSEVNISLKVVTLDVSKFERSNVLSAVS